MYLIVDTRDLTKTFGSLVAVDHVDMNVKRGEIFGFLGLGDNGSLCLSRCTPNPLVFSSFGRENILMKL